MADYLGSCKQDDFQKLRGGLIKHMVGPAMELSHGTATGLLTSTNPHGLI